MKQGEERQENEAESSAAKCRPGKTGACRGADELMEESEIYGWSLTCAISANYSLH